MKSADESDAADVRGGEAEKVVRQLRQQVSELEHKLATAERTRDRTFDSLRAGGNRLTAILELLGDVLVSMNRDGVCLEVIRADPKVTIQPTEQVVGRSLEEFGLSPELAAQTRESLASALDSGEHRVFEYQRNVPLGLRDFESRMIPIGEDEVLCLVRDITERKEFERELAYHREQLEERVEERTALLRQSERRFRSLADHGIEIVCEFGPDLELLYVNSQLTEALGYPLPETPLRSNFEVVHPEDRAPVAEHVRAALDGRNPGPLEFRVMHVDGSWVPLEGASSLYQRRQGEPRVLTLIRDLTQRKRDEAVLRQNERLASLGTLCAGIAHQINNPIGAIVAGSEYALLCDDQPDTWRETLHDNLESARRCGRIVQGVLQFARDEPSEKTREDLREIVRHSCQAMMGDVSSRYCELSLELAEAPCPVFVDPIQIQQVLVNMISNGIQAVPADARVVISMELGEREVRVDVRDRGRGIEEEIVKHLFDPFFTTRLEEGGTGLGLAISHGIVADHGGRLEVSSQPGAGTVVSLTLPLEAS